MNDSVIDTNTRRPTQKGPPLAPLAAISVGLLVAGIAVGVGLHGVMPLPYGSATAIMAYVDGCRLAGRVIAFGVFGSSIPLAIYAATAGSRLRQLGVTAPGSTIALAGGLLAATGLALSALLIWTLSRPEVAGDRPLVRALCYLAFLSGGPWHVVGLGLLIAGIAVPGLIIGLLPRPVAWAGLAIAALAELTTLVLIWPVLSPMLPAARLAGLGWLIVAGALLPTRRRNRREALAGAAR